MPKSCHVKMFEVLRIYPSIFFQHDMICFEVCRLVIGCALVNVCLPQTA